MAKKLPLEQVSQLLTELNDKLPANKHWQLKDGKLLKTFKFSDFVQAFAWMTKVAIYAEKYNHHPEWFNVWNRVDVAMVTHDVDGVSELDFKLIELMERAA
jgi:4a-hydroxytetrahydrobiopterin dehydratase